MADEKDALGKQYSPSPKQKEKGLCHNNDNPKNEWGQYQGHDCGPRSQQKQQSYIGRPKSAWATNAGRTRHDRGANADALPRQMQCQGPAQNRPSQSLARQKENLPRRQMLAR